MFPTLSDEQRRFIATIRELAQSEFRERAPRYQDGTFPWENMKALAELGSEVAAGAFMAPAGFGVTAAIELARDKAAPARAICSNWRNRTMPSFC